MTESLQRLRAELDQLRDLMRARWHRELPMQELLDDRWERARRLGFGEGTSIYAESYVYGDVQVGANTWIGPMTLLDGSGGLRIGDACAISAGVQIYTHDTVARTLSGGRSEVAHAQVTIEDHCHIGAQAVIAKGVTIGTHSVVGACAFVNRDVPGYSVVVGVPARVIGRVVVDQDGQAVLDHGDRRGRPTG
jgi:acetyltransferase-like isoleucine patch superfamily enzyme